MKDMRLSRLRNHKNMLWASIIVILLLVAIIPSMIRVNLAEIPPATMTYFFVDPETSTASVGTTFVVDINVTNAPPGTHSWEFKLGWDNSVVNLTWGEVPTPGDFFAVNATGLIYTPIATANATGSITVGQSLVGANVTSGSGTLCSLNFTVGLAGGSCELSLSATSLDFVDGSIVPVPNRDGFFYESGASVFDVAVTSVTKNATTVDIGQDVEVNVTVTNQGTTGNDANFSATVFADCIDVYVQDPSNPLNLIPDVGEEIALTPQSYTLSLAPTSSATLTFVWDTTGASGETYTVSGNVTLSNAPDDDLHDNLFIDGTVTVRKTNDLKVTNVDILTPEVVRGNTASINVTVLNQGQSTESSFDVTVYADLDTATLRDEVTVGTQTVSSLAPQASTTLTFNWATAWPQSGTYTITADVEVVLGETETSDNTLTDGTVKVKVFDISIQSVEVQNPVLLYGNRLLIRYTIKNEGSENYAGQIFFYCNMTQSYETGIKGAYPILPSINGSIPIGTLESLESLSSWGIWDTTGTAYFPPLYPGKYNFSAYIIPVANEEDVTDNSFVPTSGFPPVNVEIIVYSRFDVNLDFKVNSLDVKLAKLCLSGYYNPTGTTTTPAAPPGYP